jgi:ubiquinone/menaquinone biosynthesis C-methylase UbiE
VLDVGCGTGLLGRYVAERVGPEGLVIGLDPLPSRVEVARRHVAAHFQVRVGRAEDLSEFPEGRFDRVYLNSVLHWLPDQPLALREAARVLKAGGRLGICTASKERPSDLDQVLGSVFGAGSPLANPITHRVDAIALRALLEQVGLNVTRMELRAFPDRFQDVDEVMAFQASSSFGNTYADLDGKGLERVRAALDRGLAGHRHPDGSIQLRRHATFAVASKR